MLVVVVIFGFRTMLRWTAVSSGKKLEPVEPHNAAWVPSDSEPEPQEDSGKAQPGFAL
jgi:hypothetical protein